MASKPKTFYIFEVPKSKSDTDMTLTLEFRENVFGNVGEARDAINNDEYKDGMYLVLEDTSGYITKATVTTTKASVSFDPPRKKERKVKDVTAPAAKAKKKTPPPVNDEVVVKA